MDMVFCWHGNTTQPYFYWTAVKHYNTHRNHTAIYTPTRMTTNRQNWSPMAVGRRIEVTYAGSCHYGQKGRVTKVHATRLSVVFEDLHGGNWVEKCHALVVPEVIGIPYMSRANCGNRNRTRSEHRRTRMHFFACVRRNYGFTSPVPRRPYIKMVTGGGLENLMMSYRYAYRGELTKPHVVRSAIGNFTRCTILLL
jgi:hypothetical protein